MTTKPREGLKTKQPHDLWGYSIYYIGLEDTDSFSQEEGWYWEPDNYTPGSNMGPQGPYEKISLALKDILVIQEEMGQ